jgi:Domain of unknown function (DUF4290)
MKEYGSNTQKLVDYIVSIPDKEKRTKHAHILIELMRQIHPQMREGIDYSKKLWDDLYIMANFDLDVDSPFPPPPKEILGRKPMQVPYNQHQIKHLFYGRNLELLILKTIVTESADERRAFISYLVRLMKNFYLTWNKDTVETATCLQTIVELSGYKLQEDVNYLRTNGLIEDSSPRDGNNGGPRGRQSFDGSRKPNYPRNNNNNNNNRNGNGGPNNPNNSNNRRFKDKPKGRKPFA